MRRRAFCSIHIPTNIRYIIAYFADIPCFHLSTLRLYLFGDDFYPFFPSMKSSNAVSFSRSDMAVLWMFRCSLFAIRLMAATTESTERNSQLDATITIPLTSFTMSLRQTKPNVALIFAGPKRFRCGPSFAIWTNVLKFFDSQFTLI